MHPILIKIGGLSIYSFGFMLALSFLLGIYVSTYRAKKVGLNPQHILDLSVYLIIAGVVGSRLLYVVFHLDEYESFADVFALWQGGATLYGGLLFAILAGHLFARHIKSSFLLIADVVSPALALGIMLTRVGCYMSGCCFGKATTMPWGAVFPPESPAGAYERQLSAVSDVIPALHPAQLYASFFGLVVFVTLVGAQRKLVKRGAMFGAFLLLYGVFRFTLDFFRYYEPNMLILWNLTLNQLISVGLAGVGSYLLLRKAKETAQAGT
jgi:phosphatidylglycerol:prolipoprotein diacylglycerol transferase